MSITFLTFGGQTKKKYNMFDNQIKKYHNNVDRICKEAAAFNIFNNIVGL
jgi:hypothetical protein